jgi:hypothetical protein
MQARFWRTSNRRLEKRAVVTDWPNCWERDQPGSLPNIPCCLESDGQLTLQDNNASFGLAPCVLPNAPLLQQLVRHGKPREVGERTGNDTEPSVFGRIEPECLVPTLGADDRLTGVILLGPRLSEESYSVEDRRLLAESRLKQQSSWKTYDSPGWRSASKRSDGPLWGRSLAKIG